MQTDAEHQLLQQAQAGDYDAFEALYELLYPAVWRFAARMMSDAADAEDIAQQTFIAFYQHLERIDPPEMLRPYVFKIARNQCIDAMRKAGRYEQTALDENTPTGQVRLSFNGTPPPGPEEAVHWMLVRLEVEAAIDRLPPLQRETLILYADEQLSLKEIAVTMETNVSTVKSRLYHARRGLRGLLHPQTLGALNALFETNDKKEDNDHAPPTEAAS